MAVAAAAAAAIGAAVAAATMNLYSYVVPSAQNPIYNIVREESAKRTRNVMLKYKKKRRSRETRANTRFPFMPGDSTAYAKKRAIETKRMNTGKNYGSRKIPGPASRQNATNVRFRPKKNEYREKEYRFRG